MILAHPEFEFELYNFVNHLVLRSVLKGVNSNLNFSFASDNHPVLEVV
jgi:hypothetical protein